MAPASWAGGSANIPAWLSEAAAKPKGEYPSRTNAVVLLDETTINVQENGDRIATYRRAVRILRPEGRDDAVPEVHFDDQNKLLSLHAWSISPTGQQYEVKEKEFVETAPYDGEMYSEERIKFVKLAGTDPGAVVGWEFQQRERPYLFGDEWQFQEELPVKQARLNLILPHGWEAKTSWVRHEELKPQQPSQNSYIWEVADLPGIERQPMMPRLSSIYGRMMITYFAPAGINGVIHSWDDMGKWYTALAAGRRDPSPEIRASALQLTESATTPVQKVRAIAGYLQRKVRYVAIEIGIGGFQPHPAALTFKNNYGDCKDKATLMGSMLQAVGVDSYYVLVHTSRGRVTPDAAVDQFNHMILAIKVPQASTSELHSLVTLKNGEQVMIFDPTDEYTPVGQINRHLQGGYALVVTKDGGEMVKFPVLAPEINQVKRFAHLKLLPNGAVQGTVEVHLTGAGAWDLRYEMVHADQKKRREMLERGLARYLNGFVLEKGTILNLDSPDQELILQYDFTTTGYAKTADPLMLVRPRIVGEMGEYLDEKPRKYPFEFLSESLDSDVFEFELPAGYKVDELPDPVKLDLGFARYQSKTEFTDGKLRYQREYRVSELQLPMERVGDLRKLFSVINADERASAVLKKQ
jgi:hypothetical protein